MSNNLNVRILEIYKDIDKIYNDINHKIFNFINKAIDLVELSDNMYQIEQTIKLNKISLKGYILDSSCCKILKENNISNYSIEELNQYLLHYEKITNDNCLSYYLAIYLYKLLEIIEKLVDNKTELEINKLAELLPSIYEIKNINDNNYEYLYNKLKNQLINDYFNQNLIDHKSFNVCIQIINDIFYYYTGGYPNISEEFIKMA